MHQNVSQRTHSVPIDASNLALVLDRRRGTPPMIQQLVAQVRSAIEGGTLLPGARLPASRGLARELGVSRTVVTEVYAILVAEGYLDSVRGSGTYVVEGHGEPRPPLAFAAEAGGRPRWLKHPIAPPAIDPSGVDEGLRSFHICEPEPSSFPDSAWRTCARAALAEDLPPSYGPPAGDDALRQAIATWVSRERGLACAAADVVVTSGTTQSLDLIARATLTPGDRIAFENPGYRLARQIFSDAQATICPIEVDDEGLRVEQLDPLLTDSGPASGGDRGPAPLLVYTTPSHQFPMGSVLSYSRRQDLLHWAGCHETLIIEDDYDSEFRLDGPALPPLAASDTRGSVVYLGTFSKALAPSLRVGYLIAPPSLRQAVLHLKARSGHPASWTTQRALARYLTSGAFGRHLRRMRRLYRERRDILVAAFEPLPGGCRWLGLAAGLHATLRLPVGVASARVAERCRRDGLLLRTSADYAVAPLDFEGLVLGYGARSCDELRDMAGIVRRAITLN